MKYLPILQELFESDTIVFWIIGLVIAVIIGLGLKSKRKNFTAAVISIAVYAVCEVVSNIRSNYMMELILLFVGTAAIGCFIGFLLSLLINAIKTAKKHG